MLAGYLRVSTDSDRQVLDLPQDALLADRVDEQHLLSLPSQAWSLPMPGMLMPPFAALGRLVFLLKPMIGPPRPRRHNAARQLVQRLVLPGFDARN